MNYISSNIKILSKNESLALAILFSQKFVKKERNACNGISAKNKNAKISSKELVNVL